MQFRDIKQYTRSANYMVNVDLAYLPDHLAHYVLEYNLDVSPDFQRGYVWTMEQKTAFVEHLLRGGRSGMAIYLNCPGWSSMRAANAVLVDGKQRLEASLCFLNNEVPVFGGHYCKDFTDKLRLLHRGFEWHVNELETREECLQWYLEMNTGGTVHTQDELDKVRSLIDLNVPYVVPPKEELFAKAGLDRPIFADAVHKIEEEKLRMEASRLRAREQPPTPKKKGKKK